MAENKVIALREQEIFLQIPVDCDLKCIFCGRSLNEYKKRNHIFKKKEILSELLEAYQKSKIKRLRIEGADPLKYRGIIEVIKHANEIGFKDILLATNGITLVDKQLVGILNDSGLKSIELPIYGPNDIIHDRITGVKGSFKNLLKGISNLKKHSNVKIVLHTLLLKQNFTFIPQLYNFVVNALKIHDFRYLRLDPRNDNPVDYYNYCPSYTQINHLLKANPVMDVAFDVPFCVLPNLYLKNIKKRYRGKFYRRQLPFVDKTVARISENSIFLRNDIKLIHKSGKMVKPPKCKKCKLSRLCKGIFELYLRIFTDKELRPL